MCLGIPGRILAAEGGSVAMARVDMGGVQRDVCLAYVPEASVGDYVLVHVGFAVRVMDEAEAQGTIELLRSAGVELGTLSREDL
jgi:hydrogenase expression/formation protein HypC